MESQAQIVSHFWMCAQIGKSHLELNISDISACSAENAQYFTDLQRYVGEGAAARCSFTDLFNSPPAILVATWLTAVIDQLKNRCDLLKASNAFLSGINSHLAPRRAEDERLHRCFPRVDLHFRGLNHSVPKIEVLVETTTRNNPPYNLVSETQSLETLTELELSSRFPLTSRQLNHFKSCNSSRE